MVNLIGWGGQRFAEQKLGWDRKTIRKGQRELAVGQCIIDGRYQSGRKRAEEHFPQLLEDIEAIVSPFGQTDPTFRSVRLYTPITAREVRDRLIRYKGYSPQRLIGERSLRSKLNALGYRPQRVKKCLPLKRIPETDAIFEQLHQVNAQADAQPDVLRISLDTKAAVKVGAYSRGGQSRCPEKAWDHDFDPEATLTPFGILLPDNATSFLWFTAGKVTADFMVDRIEEMWAEIDEADRPHTLVINADNGPENSGHRRQWLKRLVKFSDTHNVTVQLAYYPPYHSKYNPVERLWGVLENHWRGELLTSVEKTLGLARSMLYKGIKPTVRKVAKAYKAGVSLTDKAMNALEERLYRQPGLESWCIQITPIVDLG